MARTTRFRRLLLLPALGVLTLLGGCVVYPDGGGYGYGRPYYGRGPAYAYDGGGWHHHHRDW